MMRPNGSPPARPLFVFGVFLIAACGGGSDAAPAVSVTGVAETPVVLEANATQSALVGTSFTYDATKANRAFTDPRGQGLSYSVTFTPAANGLSAASGRVTGTPTTPGVIIVTITARDAKGAMATNTFRVVTFGPGLTSPLLPATPFLYADADVPLPAHFRNGGAPGGSVVATDNTPASNPISNAGAMLGRVLFYDPRLSANDRQSCSGCHLQSHAFGDTARFSHGFQGGLTGRHANGLTNARFYARGRFFWDERAATLEDQVLQPIQNATEMGLTLDDLEVKLAATSFYPALFQQVFGTPQITRGRVSLALAQFVRSMVSFRSPFDAAFTGGGTTPNFAVLTAQEQLGQQLFAGSRCDQCHATNAQVSDNIHNNGLDVVPADTGAGGGRFKAPSLRNVGVRTRFMHDGRFSTLSQVVDFYNSGVQGSANLDRRLTGGGGQPQRLGLSQGQRDAMVAYLHSLTDQTFLSDGRFGDPFKR